MWTVGFVIVNQLAFYVMVHRATAGTAAVAQGATSASGFTVYSNAFLLTQVPHSIVTVSLATAAMPVVSGLAADGRFAEVGAEMARTLRLVLALIVPFGVALLVLGPALATVMFSWGQAAGDTSSLGLTLVAFAPGLVMFSVHYVVLRGYYALEDTRTPFFIQCGIAMVNIVLAIGLTVAVQPRLVAPVLALAYGASYAVGAVMSSVLLSRRLAGLGAVQLAGFAARVAVAATPAALLSWAAVHTLEAGGLNVASKSDSLVLLAAGGAVGVLAYVAAARALRISEVKSILRLASASRFRD
jgi:putative peptidoglycan lipid II flippase